MSYLKIENPGVAPVECFTLMGVSTTRYSGNSEAIGMFGTGAKHAINLFLRKKMEVSIFCGLQCMEYFTTPKYINGHTFHQVCVNLSGKDENDRQIKRREDLGWVLENGELDWDDISMACREFVCNAFDRTILEGMKHSAATFEIVDDNQVRAKRGTTRVFIPLTEEVRQFYHEMPRRFLFLMGIHRPGLLSKTVNRHIKHNKGPVIFRKGVYVHELLDATVPSLFDYNFDNDLRIDEARNVSESSLSSIVSKRIQAGDPQQMDIVINALKSRAEYWEWGLNRWDLQYCIEDENKEKWKTAWNRITFKAVPCLGITEKDIVEKKGHVALVVPESWYYFLQTCGITTATTILTKEELEGTELKEPTEPLYMAFDAIWEWLLCSGYTMGKVIPELKVFRKMEPGDKTKGYYRDNTVFINEEIIGQGSLDMKITIIEELTHHITGATDMSRQFQEFLLKIIAEQVF